MRSVGGSAGESRQLWEQGLELQLLGDLERAAGLYRRSLDVAESAEAWTFLGWCHSWAGDLDEAVQACRRAIAVDPAFGNAHNDLGVYLLELGEIDEAIASLSAAKFCARYETPQFPYLNTARLLIRRGQLGAAAIELQAARLLAPADPRIDELFEYVSVLVLARAA